MKDVVQHITTEELAEIMDHITVKDVIDTKALAEEWTAKTEQHKSDFKWNYYILLTAIYTAGRVQGMREVRFKNKSKKQLP